MSEKTTDDFKPVRLNQELVDMTKKHEALVKELEEGAIKFLEDLSAKAKLSSDALWKAITETHPSLDKDVRKYNLDTQYIGSDTVMLTEKCSCPLCRSGKFRDFLRNSKIKDDDPIKNRTH